MSDFGPKCCWRMHGPRLYCNCPCHNVTPADSQPASDLVEKAKAFIKEQGCSPNMARHESEAEELINSADEICLKEPDKGRAVVLKLNSNGKWWVCFDDSRGMISDRKDYDSALEAFRGYKYPKGENL